MNLNNALYEQRIESYSVSIKDLPDVVKNRAAELKAMFDSRTDHEVKDSINGIIDTLRATGSSYTETGAACIAGRDAEGGETTVQEHMKDTTNPHLVTAEQVGAYTKAEVENLIRNAEIEAGAGDMLQRVYDNEGSVLAAGGIANFVNMSIQAAIVTALNAGV